MKFTSTTIALAASSLAYATPIVSRQTSNTSSSWSGWKNVKNLFVL